MKQRLADLGGAALHLAHHAVLLPLAARGDGGHRGEAVLGRRLLDVHLRPRLIATAIDYGSAAWMWSATCMQREAWLDDQI